MRRLLLLGAGIVVPAAPAFASQPLPWQIGFQPAASPIMEMIQRFSDGLMIVISLIVAVVLGLLLYCMFRFRAGRNPVPSNVSHHTVIEVIWTVVPILVLVGIAVPSFSLMFAQHDPARAIPGFNPDSDRQLTIKATGVTWYWTYQYPDNGDIEFDSFMLDDEALAANPDAGPRLLAVDNAMVVPVGTVIRLHVIGADFLHAFAVPALGVKIDAVPGRLNETWFRADREGIYYGQCSELCGRGHAFMPIAVRAVGEAQFDAWAAAAVDDLDAANALLAEAGSLDTTMVAQVAHR